MEIITDRLSVRELATMMTLLDMLGIQSEPSELQQKFQKNMDTVRSAAVATRSSKDRRLEPPVQLRVDLEALEATF